MKNILLILVLMGILAIPSLTALVPSPSGKVIIHLGGNPRARILKTIEMANLYPDANVVISTEGESPWMIEQLDNAGIARSRWIYDLRAWDTVTNFALTQDLILDTLKCKQLYVVTDYFHIDRSMIIAKAIYFWKGVEVIASPYMGGDLTYVESWTNKIYDSNRAIMIGTFGLVFFDFKTYSQRWAAVVAECATAKSILGADSSSLRC